MPVIDHRISELFVVSATDVSTFVSNLAVVFQGNTRGFFFWVL